MSRIETHRSIESYFSGLLEDALNTEQLRLDSVAQTYLVQLASDFTHHEALHAGGKDGERGTPALTWLYERAVNAVPAARFDAYRRLGDVALVVSGFFAPHIERERSLVDVGYYVGMGGAAYQQASHLAGLDAFRSMFSELSQSFSRIVEVFARVAEKTTLPVRRDLGTIYERWMRNPSSVSLNQQLLELGFAPVALKVAS